jgi:hypothetical protein
MFDDVKSRILDQLALDALGKLHRALLKDGIRQNQLRVDALRYELSLVLA